MLERRLLSDLIPEVHPESDCIALIADHAKSGRAAMGALQPPPSVGRPVTGAHPGPRPMPQRIRHTWADDSEVSAD